MKDRLSNIKAVVSTAGPENYLNQLDRLRKHKQINYNNQYFIYYEQYRLQTIEQENSKIFKKLSKIIE